MYILITIIISIFASKTSSLKCYECANANTDPIPYCNADFFKLLNETEQQDFENECGEGLDRLCITKQEIRGTTVFFTERGCSSGFDVRRREIPTGCAILITENKGHHIRLCACKGDNCNSGNKAKITGILILLIGLIWKIIIFIIYI